MRADHEKPTPRTSTPGHPQTLWPQMRAAWGLTEPAQLEDWLNSGRPSLPALRLSGFRTCHQKLQALVSTHQSRQDVLERPCSIRHSRSRAAPRCLPAANLSNANSIPTPGRHAVIKRYWPAICPSDRLELRQPLGEQSGAPSVKHLHVVAIGKVRHSVVTADNDGVLIPALEKILNYSNCIRKIRAVSFRSALIRWVLHAGNDRPTKNQALRNLKEHRHLPGTWAIAQALYWQILRRARLWDRILSPWRRVLHSREAVSSPEWLIWMVTPAAASSNFTSVTAQESGMSRAWRYSSCSCIKLKSNPGQR